MTYFADVRDRPAYCSAHLVPLQSLSANLASAATTPNFARVGANDCTDMEGCGIRAGDEFLATELGAIERSPAWRTQHSLAIITFDEDGYDHEHPAQRVATLVLGSAGVQRGTCPMRGTPTTACFARSKPRSGSARCPRTIVMQRLSMTCSYASLRRRPQPPPRAPRGQRKAGRRPPTPPRRP